jgi:hypothetical protein
MMDAAEDGRAAGDARFEVAAAEEEERSAEEQESERRADGEQARARVVVGSTFKFKDKKVVVKSADTSGEPERNGIMGGYGT